MDAPRKPRAIRRGRETLERTSVVRVGPLMGLPALVRELGCDPAPLFRDAGFEMATFDDPDARVPYVAGSRLLARCIEATGREDFGLLIGQRASPSSLGIAGYILRTAPDVRAALNGLERHFDLHDEGGTPFVTTTRNVSLLGFAIHQPGVSAAGEIYDLAIAVACNIMRGLCGGGWCPSEVLLSRRPPRDPAPWQRFFQAPLRFDADRSAVAFPSRWLEHRLPGADSLLHRHLEAEAAALRAQRETNLVGVTRGLLRQLLAARRISIGEVARQLGMHARTLERRLHDEDTTFQREVDAVRYATAQQLLADTAMSITRVAAVLDYADASAFSRAFRRWAGTTPAQWRAEKVSGTFSGVVRARRGQVISGKGI